MWPPTVAMKRSKHYRACLVLLASMGVSIAPLLVDAKLSTAKALPVREARRTTKITATESPSPKQSADPSAVEADQALTEGLNFIRQGDIVAAIASFERSVSLNPNSAAAQYNLGLALRQNNQLQAAATAFWQATQADPEFVLAYVNLGAALLEGESLEQAVPY